MTFQESLRRAPLYITKFIGCRMMDKRTGMLITEDIYRLGSADRNKLYKELLEYGYELKSITDAVTRLCITDLNELFINGKEVK